MTAPTGTPPWAEQPAPPAQAPAPDPEGGLWRPGAPLPPTGRLNLGRLYGVGSGAAWQTLILRTAGQAMTVRVLRDGAGQSGEVFEVPASKIVAYLAALGYAPKVVSVGGGRL